MGYLGLPSDPCCLFLRIPLEEAVIDGSLGSVSMSTSNKPAELGTATSETDFEKYPASYKLGQMYHEKCGEWTGERTLVWIPIDWTHEQFEAAVYRARENYLNYLKAFKDMKPPEGYIDFWGTREDQFIAQHPDLTVRAAKELWEEQKRRYEEWDAERQRARKDFDAYLRDEGCLLFWQYKPDEFFVLMDWGHHHGYGINWKETKSGGPRGPLNVHKDED